MSALGCGVRLATLDYPRIVLHGAVAAIGSPRHHRQEAVAAQRVKPLLLDCSHLLTAVQPRTQNGQHLPFPFV